MKKFENSALIISGNLGSGKTTAAKYISRKYGYQHLSFVEEIWKPILSKRGMECNRKNLQELGVELMKNPGPEKIVKKLLNKAIPQKEVIIDDVRRSDIVLIFKNLCSSVFLVYIESDFQIRYPRLVIRNGVKSKEEQINAEKVETETTILELKEIANIVIVNESGIENLYQELDRVVEKFETKAKG